MNKNFAKKILFTLEILLISTCLIYTIQFFIFKTNNNSSQDLKPASNPKLIRSIFNEIYNKNLWEKHGLGYGGGSGWGSSINFTKQTRDIIFKVINKYKIKSMIDAPCGSMVWMEQLLNNLTKLNVKFKYLGIDVVDSILNEAKLKFRNKNIQFLSADFTQLAIDDEYKYEIIFSRDGLQHLPLVKIVDSLRVFAQVKGAKYLLVSSYLNNMMNKNIRVGDYFPINLTRHPFNLTGYVSVFEEMKAKVVTDQKYLLLYDIPNYINKIDFESMKHDANKMK